MGNIQCPKYTRNRSMFYMRSGKLIKDYPRDALVGQGDIKCGYCHFTGSEQNNRGIPELILRPQVRKCQSNILNQQQDRGFSQNTHGAFQHRCGMH